MFFLFFLAPLALYLLLYKLNYFRFNLYKNINPFWVFFFIKFYVFFLPGVLYVFFSEYNYLRVGVHSVSDATIRLVTFIIIFFSLSVFFILTILEKAGGSMRLMPKDLCKRNFPVFFLEVLFVFQLSILILQICLLRDGIPIFEILKGNFEYANLLKAKILKHEIKTLSNTVVLAYWSKYIIYFVPFVSLYYYRYAPSRKVRFMLFSSLVISIFYLLLEGHKAPAFLFLTSFIVFRYYLFGFRLSIANVFLLVFLPLGLLVLYIFSFGYADSLSYGVKKFLERLFVGQTQGLYYVVEYVDPSISYIKSMLPFSSLFFSDATRAVEDVVSYVYGFSVTTVNMNSLFITDAYSIFGILGVIFFTVYFSFFVYILFIFLKSFSRSFHVIVIPLSFVIFALLPITNTLTYFVFPKELFSVFILFFGIGLFYNCLTKNKHKVMN